MAICPASSRRTSVRFKGTGDSVTLESLLDELRLEGPKYKEHRNEALRRFFALRQAERLRLNVDARRKKTTEAEFRQERELVDTAALKHWMTNNDLTLPSVRHIDDRRGAREMGSEAR